MEYYTSASKDKQYISKLASMSSVILDPFGHILQIQQDGSLGLRWKHETEYIQAQQQQQQYAQ
jgi:hypothetical protein